MTDQAKPRKTSRPVVDWQTVRAEYEAGGAGSSFNALGQRHGVSHTAVRKRALREGWTQSLEPAIQRRTAEKVSGAVSTANPQKRAEAVDAEAERRAEVQRRHRVEWTQVAALRQEALAARSLTPEEQKLAPVPRAELEALRAATAFTKAKLAKITAEMTGIQQTGERRAWRLGEEGAGDGGELVIRIERGGQPAVTIQRPAGG